MFEAGLAGLSDLERQREPGGGGFGLRPEPVGRLLREPDDALVIAEVVVAQLGVAVEPEAAPDDAVEGADEEVGEVVGARLVLGEAAEELVAVGPGQAAPVVERAPGAAVGVAD